MIRKTNLTTPKKSDEIRGYGNRINKGGAKPLIIVLDLLNRLIHQNVCFGSLANIIVTLQLCPLSGVKRT